MIKRTSLEIVLKLTAPFLFPGNTAGRFGYDKVALRDREGRLVLPQDQLRGVVREMAERMDKQDLLKMFGKPSGDARDSGSGPLTDAGRGRIFFSDFVGEFPKIEEEHSLRVSVPYPRVEVDNETGAAKEGQLVMVEQVALPGTEVMFKGSVEIFDDAPKERENDLRMIFEAMDQIGHMKSVGFGEVKLGSFGPLNHPLAEFEIPEGTRFTWSFKVDRAFLVGSVHLSGNVMQGLSEISGGALKGCLARNLELQNQSISEEQFARLRISFGRPRGTPRIAPLSVGCTDANELVDVLERQRPDIWSGITAQSDFKAAHLEVLREKFGQGNTIWEERVHTAINQRTGAADDAGLFVTLAVVPDSRGYEAVVDVSKLEREAAKAVLMALKSPLFGLGKTGATVITEALHVADPPSVQKFSSKEFAVTVNTPALLCEPADVIDLSEAYKEAWKQLLPGSRLVKYFATQQPFGRYIGRQFRRTRAYRPFWLTMPGSVFLLEVPDNQKDQLVHLCNRGAIIPMADGAPADWKTCPFLPENGYGDISADWKGL